MFNANHLDNLVQKLCNALPSGLQDIETDIKSSFKTVLESAFQELNLVTREEFDAQVKVLMRTREKVEALQKSLDEHSK